MKKALLFLVFVTSLIASDNENYYVSAGEAFGIEPWILWSVGDTESKHNPFAINKNSNGTYDVGVMQINSIHFQDLKQKYGIEPKDLFDPKISIYVGASLLKECFDKYGNNWKAINCYNGLNYDNRVNNTYAKKVYQNLIKGQRKYAGQ